LCGFPTKIISGFAQLDNYRSHSVVTNMFLHSKSIKSKILAAAMEVDEDYKRYRAKLYSQPEKKISV
jgi:hypothetical protein